MQLTPNSQNYTYSSMTGTKSCVIIMWSTYKIDNCLKENDSLNFSILEYFHEQLRNLELLRPQSKLYCRCMALLKLKLYQFVLFACVIQLTWQSGTT